MAQRMHVTLEDDLDGSRAEETVRFGVDGIDYEIDLSKKNAKVLRDNLAQFIEAGRRVRANRRRGGNVRGLQGDAKAIREWAVENGYDVSARGRVSAEIREAYESAH